MFDVLCVIHFFRSETNSTEKIGIKIKMMSIEVLNNNMGFTVWWSANVIIKRSFDENININPTILTTFRFVTVRIFHLKILNSIYSGCKHN